MLQNNDIVKIKQILHPLDLEKVNIIQKTEIICFPKKQDKDFKNKLKVAQEQIKKLSLLFDIVICDDGETINLIE